jgi:hypothetical protein
MMSLMKKYTAGNEDGIGMVILNCDQKRLH